MMENEKQNIEENKKADEETIELKYGGKKIVTDASFGNHVLWLDEQWKKMRKY